jgi:hypothetical protein
MAISAATVWEVRTTGNDSNGGGFVAGASGSDYSQQDAAQYTFTDLASTNGTNASPQVTSASHNFVAADVGNIIHVTAGTNWTQGFYQIVSCAANAATLDKACGSSATLSGGTYAVGGALQSIPKVIAAMVGSNTVYIKTGTYTITAAQLVTVSGNSNGATTFIGYSSSRTDLGQPTITTATNSISIFDISGAIDVSFQNFKFTNTAGTKGTNTNGNAICTATANAEGVYIFNCSFDGFTIAINWDFTAIFTMLGLVIENCIVKNSVSHGLFGTASCSIIGCYVHDNGGNGLSVGTSTSASSGPGMWHILNSIFYNNTSSGVGSTFDQNMNGFVRPLVLYNSAFVSNGVDGVRLTIVNNTQLLSVRNCIFYGNTVYGLNTIAGSGGGLPPYGALDYNAFGGNGTAPRHGGVVAGAHDVTLSGDPFNGRTSNDFSLNNTAGAGASCRGAGFPGVLQIGGTGYIDIGALQTQAGGGGSTVIVLNKNITNYRTVRR